MTLFRSSSILTGALFFILLIVRTAVAQAPALPADNTTTQGQVRQSGFHLYEAITYAGYTSLALPSQGIFSSETLHLGSDVNFGMSAVTGWDHFGAKTNIKLTYSPSYSGQWKYTDWNAFNHAATMLVNRHLSSRWTLRLSGHGALQTLDQFLFTPTQLSTVASVPSTFDDLAAAALGGKFSNNQLASILTGAPVVESPATTLLFGNRFGYFSTQARAEYARSPRLTFYFSGGFSRIEHFQGNGSPDIARNSYLLAHVSSEDVNLGFNYSLSPRTTAGLELISTRSISPIQSSYTSMGIASITHIFNRKWYASIHAGGGLFAPIGTSYLHEGPRTVGGGSLAYKTLSHIFLASYDRSASAEYGVGAVANSFNGSWDWSRPKRSWSLFSSVGYQGYDLNQQQSLHGWVTRAGVSRSITRKVRARGEYAFLKSHGRLSLLPPYGIASHSVRVSFIWSPGQYPMSY